MNMFTSFDSVCAPSSSDPGFCPDSISNAPGGATETLPDPGVPSPTFILHFFFQLEFWSCDQQLLWFVSLFFTRRFPVTLSAIVNVSSIWLSNWKQSWAMVNIWSFWCHMIWDWNAFASKMFWWADCDVAAFALSTCPWREMFRARSQSLSIVICCTILSRETISLAALHWLYTWCFCGGSVVSMEVISAGGWSTTTISAMAYLCLWKEDPFFRLRPMPDFFLL